MSYGGQCDFCGERVDAEHAAYKITGVEYTRDQGGQNAVREKKRVPNWIAHKHCHERYLRLKEMGVIPGQTSLVD